MTHYPCNYTKIRTTQRTTPRRSGHDKMEAQAMHALQRHPARQMATMHTDRCGAASSRPTRTTSTRSPEALLRCTHASWLQRGQPSSLAAAMSCEHRCDRKGRDPVRSGLQHGYSFHSLGGSLIHQGKCVRRVCHALHRSGIGVFSCDFGHPRNF